MHCSYVKPCGFITSVLRCFKGAAFANLLFLRSQQLSNQSFLCHPLIFKSDLPFLIKKVKLLTKISEYIAGNIFEFTSYFHREGLDFNSFITNLFLPF